MAKILIMLLLSCVAKHMVLIPTSYNTLSLGEKDLWLDSLNIGILLECGTVWGISLQM